MRYYQFAQLVFLLFMKKVILEKKVHSKLNASINDFNNRFYNLKNKEQKACKKFGNRLNF